MPTALEKVASSFYFRIRDSTVLKKVGGRCDSPKPSDIRVQTREGEAAH